MYHIEGGKVNVKKQFRKASNKMNKGFTKVNPINALYQDKGFNKFGADVGKFTNNELLPAVVSTAIPLGSAALGMVGMSMGIPPELTAGMTQSLLEQYIPQQYQSNNPYVQALGSAMSMGLTGDADPYAMMNMSNQLQQGVYKGSTENQQHYNMPKSNDLYFNQEMKKQPMQDVYPNDDNDALYNSAEMYDGGDEMKVVVPPYQQREGSSSALFGAGLSCSRPIHATIRRIGDIERDIKEILNKPSDMSDTDIRNINILFEELAQYGKRYPAYFDESIDLKHHYKDIYKNKINEQGQKLIQKASRVNKARTKSRENNKPFVIEDYVDEVDGSGLKKKKKSKNKVVKVEIISTLPHKRFSHAKNASLDQLLEAKALKEEKDYRKLQKKIFSHLEK